MSVSSDPSPSDPIRALIVDDSAIIRGFVTRAIEEVDDVVVVGSVANGQTAVNLAERELIDIIILDIEMPVMDGLTAIPLLRKASPWSRIIMSSTLTLQGAEVSLRAMALGAADYVAKPSSTREAGSTGLWKQDLLAKVHALGASAWRERQRLGKTGPLPAGVKSPVPTAKKSDSPTKQEQTTARSRLYEGKETQLRALPPAFTPEVLAIGSSTGGPQALFQVLPHLCSLRQPILITQHMPRTFTALLADHITRQSGLPCTEAKDGEHIVGGHAYLAPGDYHMLVERQKGVPTIRLTQDPPENFCRPAVDPMFRSVSSTYGANKVLMAILTGMGSDGMRGANTVVPAGGVLVAQDQQSSIVWGMPGAVATAGLCHAVLPVAEIGPWLRRKATGAAA